MWLCALGFALEGGESYEQAVTMLRRTFPYLFFISITAMLAAALNAHRKFAAAAFTPVLMNVCLIAAAALYAMQADPQGAVLGWGVFVGGIGADGVSAGVRPRHLRLVPAAMGLAGLECAAHSDADAAGHHRFVGGPGGRAAGHDPRQLPGVREPELAEFLPAPDGISAGRVRRGPGHRGAAPAFAPACGGQKG